MKRCVDSQRLLAFILSFFIVFPEITLAQIQNGHDGKEIVNPSHVKLLYPESFDDHGSLPPDEGGSNDVSVCISGGGSRSLSAAAGQLAVLLSRYEKQIRIISAPSGGAWAATSYYMLPDANLKAKYLGEVVDDLQTLYFGESGDENPANLGWIDQKSLAAVPRRIGFVDSLWQSLVPGWQSIAKSKPWYFWFYSHIPDFGKVGFTGWKNYVSKAILQPIGLNPDAVLEPAVFKQKPEDMQIIVTAAMENKDGQRIPFEITPGAVGARATKYNRYGYMIPPAYFGNKVNNISYEADGHYYLGFDEGKGFTLADMLGLTSAQYVNLPGFNTGFGKWLTAPSFLYPELELEREQARFDSTSKYFMDSGDQDFLAIMPLLLRNQKKIIAFINSGIPLKKSAIVVGMEKVIPSYFGTMADESAARSYYQRAADSSDYKKGGCLHNSSRNQVFSSERYQELANEFWKAKITGKPIVFLQRDLKVLDNDCYGVKGGGVIDVLWVYNDLPDGWIENQLNPELQTKIRDNKILNSLAWYGGGKFPTYSAVFDLYLPPAGIKLLFHLSAWTLGQSKSELLYMFGK